MTRVTVSRDVLHWAQTRSGVPTRDLKKKFPKLEEWEAGEVAPTLRQLESFAKKTQTPFGYLLLAEPPEDQLPIPSFRTLADDQVQKPSPNLLETVYTMLRRQGWLRDFLVEQGQPPLDYVGSATLDDSRDAVAHNMRQVLGLDTSWATWRGTWTDALVGLRHAAEEAGVVVVINGVVGNDTHRKLDPGEFRGFVLSDDYAPLVFLNGADGKAAQMFTLAHELAHLWFAKSAAFDLRELKPARNRVEQICNRIAAEFLLPESELRARWPEVRHDVEPFQSLARLFKVSTIVAARRALDLGLIDRRTFSEFYEAYREDERRTPTRTSTSGDFWATQNTRIGLRFGDAVVRAAREGRLLYRDAYDLTGLQGTTFDKYVRRIEARDR